MLFNINDIIEFLYKENFISRNINIIFNNDISITGFSNLKNSKENTISWLKDNCYDLESVNSSILICPEKHKLQSDKIILIPVKNPRLAFARLVENFYEKPKMLGIESTVKIGKNVKIGNNVYIGHYTVIGDNVKIGDNTCIKSNVSIYENVTIGNNCLINSGVVLGADGFGYEKDDNNNVIKIIHLGGIEIGNNVEIGSNTCIDRGTLDNTVIKDNVKIDNLCHIAHNAVINDNSFVIALSMIAGSVIIENDVWIAPGTMIKEKLKIGEFSKLGLGAVVVKNVEPRDIVAGVPAKSLKK